jgi:hypothetical protein
VKWSKGKCQFGGRLELRDKERKLLLMPLGVQAKRMRQDLLHQIAGLLQASVQLPVVLCASFVCVVDVFVEPQCTSALPLRSDAITRTPI